jgi:hypothetical protein
MAERAQLRITVTNSRNASTVNIRSVGRYRGLDTNGEAKILTDLPVYGTVSESAFWTAVLEVVQSNV